jgi:membrane protein YdbS with pleckstrin-like domain
MPEGDQPPGLVPPEADGFLERSEALLASLLRLPAAGPEPPPGSGQVRLFRAAPRYLHYNLVRWGVSQCFALLGLGIGVGFIAALPPALWPLRFLEALGIVLFVAQLPISFAAVWLDYNRRWYLVTDRSLRIREGVWKMHERTMSFANVQNLEVRQGPLYRLLGIASLEARSAGGGQAQGAKGQGARARDDLHVAYFRGVDNAEEIRDLILARLRGLRDTGLGDLDEDHRETAPPPSTGAAITGSTPARDAARALLAEARALRALLTNE